MQNVGLGNIQYVGPDGAGMGSDINEYVPLLMKDPVIMSKVAHFGFHSYEGYYQDVNSSLKGSSYPESSYWVTEWNAWRDGLDDGQIGVYNYDYASECIKYLYEFLNNGASAALVWEGYDSYYFQVLLATGAFWNTITIRRPTIRVSIFMQFRRYLSLFNQALFG